MPRRSDAQRIAAYNAKTVPANVSAKVTAQLDTMHSAYTAYCNEIVPILEQIRGTLNGVGVYPMFYGVYYAFGLRLWKLVKTSDGNSAAMEAAALVTLYTARGLSAPVLQAIRTDVFNIGAPV